MFCVKSYLLYYCQEFRHDAKVESTFSGLFKLKLYSTSWLPAILKLGPDAVLWPILDGAQTDFDNSRYDTSILQYFSLRNLNIAIYFFLAIFALGLRPRPPRCIPSWAVVV